MAKYMVARTDEIGPGMRRILIVGGRSIGIFNVGGEFFALRNRCPHQGAPLCTGILYGAIDSPSPGEYHYSRPGEMLRCPWHGWEFDIRTGRSWFDPATTRVRSYGLEIVPRSTLQCEMEAESRAEGPYIAEQYPVTLEEQYLVVEINS